MMITQEIKIKTIVKANATKKFKTEVAKLLNECMKSYNIKGKNKNSENAFKYIFKSNLYYIIDNHYNIIKLKK